MILRHVRRALQYVADMFRRSSGPAEDPYAYVGARRKPRRPAGSASVALEQPRHYNTNAKSGG
jgi:hypothetical protein